MPFSSALQFSFVNWDPSFNHSGVAGVMAASFDCCSLKAGQSSLLLQCHPDSHPPVKCNIDQNWHRHCNYAWPVRQKVVVSIWKQYKNWIPAFGVEIYPLFNRLLCMRQIPFCQGPVSVESIPPFSPPPPIEYCIILSLSIIIKDCTWIWTWTWTWTWIWTWIWTWTVLGFSETYSSNYQICSPHWSHSEQS